MTDVQMRLKRVSYLFAGFVATVGILIALFFSFGRALFDAAGELTWMFAATLLPVYAGLQIYVASRILAAGKARHRIKGRTLFFIFTAWLAGILFALNLPDVVNGELVTVLTRLGAKDSLELSVGFVNPLGILMIGLSIVAAALSFLDARGPKPLRAEDED